MITAASGQVTHVGVTVVTKFLTPSDGSSLCMNASVSTSQGPFRRKAGDSVPPGFRFLARHSLISPAHQSHTSGSERFSLRYW